MKLAVVIPWFGRELKGGAEQQAWQIATRLAARAIPWRCSRPAANPTGRLGDEPSPGRLGPGAGRLQVRRFEVVKRNRAKFDNVCGRLLAMDPKELKPGVPPIPREDSAVFTSELIKAPALPSSLRRIRRTTIDSSFSLTFMARSSTQSESSVRAARCCLPARRILCLPARSSRGDLQGGIAPLLSEGEKELACRLFGAGIIPKSTFVGAGVEAVHSGADSEQW